MDLARRNLLAAAGLIAAAGPAAAQTPAPTAAQALLQLAAQSRQPFTSDPTGFDGPGWDRLVDEARRARLFLLGEEHGVWETPLLTGALFEAGGYERMAIETSPRAAADLDRAALGGVEGLKAWFDSDPETPEAMTVPFYTLRPEADLLARARAAVKGKRPTLWGLDYEVLGNDRSIALLKARAPKPAQAAVQALAEAERAAWKTYRERKDPGALFAFSGDPALVRAVRDAWARPDADSDWILTVLEETLAINRLNADGAYAQSNTRRAELGRANLVRYWRAEGHETPRVLFKMGGAHLIRGLGFTGAFDIGALAYETAVGEGFSAFNALVSGGQGSRQAAFDPANGAYGDAPVETFADIGIQALGDLAFADSHTFLDLRPLRPLVTARRADPAIARVVLGYDALVILKQTHAATLL